MKKDGNTGNTPYYLGLDIGTNSVGWAVTDEHYNLCKFKNKSMWGIRLFDEGKTAKERRAARTTRRRLARQKQRIDLLQELFAEEMAKVDDTFFIRLNESQLHLEDKTVKIKHPLFMDEAYTDREYYKEYPTIFHLRKELIESDAPHDIRLVYLACHHIIKNRGHFLIEGELGEVKKFEASFDAMCDALSNSELELEINKTNAGQIQGDLRNKNITKTEKAKRLAALFATTPDESEERDEKEYKARMENICKLMVGNKGDITKIFNDLPDDIEYKSFSFGDSTFDEQITPALMQTIPDQFAVINSIKALYDWNILADILAEEEYLSFAKVKQYKKHGENLRKLKDFLRKYGDKETYKNFFNDAKDKANYPAYIGSNGNAGKIVDVKKCSEDDFYKELKKILGAMDTERITPEDQRAYYFLLENAEAHTLLPLQRSKDNGVIPNQVHKQELKKILENAGAYLGFLKEKDEAGLTVSEKILSILTFRIPYYVGPLSGHNSYGSNSWMKRKADGKIFPWNFDEKVDREKSNEAFIARMTNKCTYLANEDVLPKNSLLYSRYMVLNEINNIRVRGEKLPVKEKQAIFHDLFEKRAKVTKKMLLKHLQERSVDKDLKEEELSGFDQDFKSKLTSYLDFHKKVFGERMCEDKVKRIVEDIIKYKTIYGDDFEMLKNVMEKEWPGEITDEQYKAIKPLRYSGWSKFSEKFLNGVEGISKETGEVFTIIDALWEAEANPNLMQLLSKEYTFTEEIEKINKENSDEITTVSYNSLVKDLYVSPGNKRSIWQTIRIAEEIKKVMGCEPKKIFVEMARGGGKKGERKESRKKKLIELYKACEEDVRKWNKKIKKDEWKKIESRDEREFRSDKLYLYYTQMGLCMYSDEKIDLGNLMSKNSSYDIDHIYPQSKVDDDSLDNRVLSLKLDNNKKGDRPLSSDIQQKQKAFWKELRAKGFISQKKYDRLTHKGDLSPEELSGFAARQLVETQQSSKAVTELFQRMYEDSKIVYVKAGWVSKFRKEDIKVLKSRLANDYHHAKDAYLNIVVGNVYNAKFSENPIAWVKKNSNKYNPKHIFDRDVKDNAGNIVWKGPCRDGEKKLLENEDGEKYGGSIDVVRKTTRQNDCLYTERTYCETGELFHATIYKKGKAQIEKKKGLCVDKYGGYKSTNPSYFALVKCKKGKNKSKKKKIVGVPIYIANELEFNPNAFKEYCEKKDLHEVEVSRFIKKNALMRVDGHSLRLIGEDRRERLEFKNNVQPIFDKQDEETIRRIEKFIAKNEKHSKKEDKFQVDEDHDRLNNEKILRLYKNIIFKLEKEKAYKNLPKNPASDLRNAEKNFRQLELTEKVELIKKVLKIISCTSASVNLEKIHLGSEVGRIRGGQRKIKKLILINQSVTGLFENRIEL